MQQIDDQEPGFATVRQARREATGRLGAYAKLGGALRICHELHELAQKQGKN